MIVHQQINIQNRQSKPPEIKEMHLWSVSYSTCDLHKLQRFYTSRSATFETKFKQVQRMHFGIVALHASNILMTR
jgi:hypothetical protein